MDDKIKVIKDMKMFKEKSAGSPIGKSEVLKPSGLRTRRFPTDQAAVADETIAEQQRSKDGHLPVDI